MAPKSVSSLVTAILENDQAAGQRIFTRIMAERASAGLNGLYKDVAQSLGLSEHKEGK
jgi:hypothetical protein